MVKLKNISGGQIVCDLADGDTLRLNNKQEKTFKEKQVTKHINNLVAKGLLLSSKVEEGKNTGDKQPVKRGKEETKNGTVQ